MPERIENHMVLNLEHDHTVCCDWCGRDLECEPEYEDENHEYLCEKCLLMLHKKGI